MGYLHIENLYKNVDILMFKECYALEKIHGTSAHVRFRPDREELICYSGGAKHEHFTNLFDLPRLYALFASMFDCPVTVYGEAYGGKMQAMSDTYGKHLKFVVFDVQVDGMWLSVPNAHDVATKLGLEFVFYEKILATIEALNEARDRKSTQAIRNGVGDDKTSEGIVARPLIELTKNNGDRLIVKHKNDIFRETKTKRDISPDKLKVLEEAEAIADEWVTVMRLRHVLDKLPDVSGMEDTGKVISAMVEDVYREAEGEVVKSREATRAIGSKTAKMFRRQLEKKLFE